MDEKKMGKNLRETIKSIIKTHLIKKRGKVFGQCLTAVGWVCELLLGCNACIEDIYLFYERKVELI